MDFTEFDDIRPYYNSEVNAAMNRIAESEYLPLLASYVYPDKDINAVKDLLRSFDTVRDFQLEVMKNMNEQVLKRSVSCFSYSGIENISPNKNYLFVSNHRDIVLDSCLLQYVLHNNGHDTSEITFGSNLMMNQLIVDIGRSNKMFRVERGASLKELYKISKHLSKYIRYVITQKHQSVWIAQRNGRTKDGHDLTDQGIVKMFAMSKRGSNVESLLELNIVPVTISYEIEPCEILKTVELYVSRRQKYVKAPSEDLNSIITGLLQPKGNVHISIGKPLEREDYETLDNDISSDFHRWVAELLDKRIIEGYKLMPTNYLAYDILSGDKTYSDKYDDSARQMLDNGMERLKEYDSFDLNELKDIYLNIYAGSVRQSL